MEAVYEKEDISIPPLVVHSSTFFSVVIRVNFENINNKSNVMKHGGRQSYFKNINSWIWDRFLR